MTDLGLGLDVIAPALAAGLLVLSTHVPLGRHVLARGIIFIDIAVAQFASLGVVLAHLVHWEELWQVQTVAFASAIAGAAMLNFGERLWPKVQEAVIGSSFVVVASLSMLLLAQDPHGGEYLRELLIGQILWTSWSSLLPLALLSALVLIAWFGGASRSSRGFYLLFAVAVTLSVQIVGVYLVFASLILPALAACRLGSRSGLAVAYAVGAVGYVAGLLLSLRYDLPSGAIIVCTLCLACILSLLLLRALRRSSKTSEDQTAEARP
jgi:zinc/manganese transport system permease protein